jgi:hypothetical protein
VWTEEKVSTNKAVTSKADLQNQTAYTVSVSVKNADGLWSDAHTVGITVSYTPPATPGIIVSAQNAAVRIDMTNPEPVDTQPSVAHNDVYKRIDGVWMRIASGIPVNSSYEDYAVSSERVTEYKVRAISAENDAYADSDPASASIKLMGVYLHSIQDPSATLHHYQFDGGGRSSNKEVEHQFMQFAGRKKKVIEYGEHSDYGVSVGVKMRREDPGAERLEQFAEKRETVCYRDGRGRLLFGVITAAPLADTNFGWETTIDVTEIDYSEEV